MGTPEKSQILETVSSGVALLDYDNDGWLDLMVVNGHVYPTVDRQGWGISMAQQPLLFHNIAGKLIPVPAVEGTGLAWEARRYRSRGNTLAGRQRSAMEDTPCRGCHLSHHRRLAPGAA